MQRLGVDVRLGPALLHLALVLLDDGVGEREDVDALEQPEDAEDLAAASRQPSLSVSLTHVVMMSWWSMDVCWAMSSMVMSPSG